MLDFLKTPISRIITLGYGLLLVGSIVHIVGYNVFTVGIIVLLLAHAGWFLVYRLSPTRRAANQLQAGALQGALAEPPPPGACFLYLYRSGSAMLPGPIITATLDGTKSADLRNGAFVRWVVPAGPHTITAAVKGTNAVSTNLGAELALTCLSGESIVLEVRTTMDLKRYTVHITREPDPGAALPRLSKLSMIP